MSLHSKMRNKLPESLLPGGVAHSDDVSINPVWRNPQCGR